MSAASSALSTQGQLHFASLENKKSRTSHHIRSSGRSAIDRQQKTKRLADDIEVEVVEHHA